MYIPINFIYTTITYKLIIIAITSVDGEALR